MTRKTRSSGILMHISSLPSKYGIGDFGEEAFKFVDFLQESKQKNWQILPLGVTGYGDSPYQCFSSYGGNPYFIDLEDPIERGYIDRAYIDSLKLNQDPERVDYGLLYDKKLALLRQAYRGACQELATELEEFYIKNQDWLKKFALFMSLKSRFNNKIWYKWPKDYRNHKSSQVANHEKENQEDIYFWVFTQYFFFKQWKKLKSYANSKNISIIGDLPIYVAEDSVDIWKNPHLFKLNGDFQPVKVAGVPPDAFTSKGQLWGNPIYNWEKMKEEDYEWWVRRLSFALEQVDVVRIDHFRGFESYWEVDYGAEDASVGQWEKGPGLGLISKIKKELTGANIIVEDLGINTSKVEELVEAAGFPNMKVLQFAFNPWDESDHIPHRIKKNSVVYTGTHDNKTAMEWFTSIGEDELDHVKDYLKLDREEGYNWGLIRGAWASTADLAIAPMQDFLCLGREGRMNKPGTMSKNWTWRMKKDSISKDIVEKISKLTELYGR